MKFTTLILLILMIILVIIFYFSFIKQYIYFSKQFYAPNKEIVYLNVCNYFNDCVVMSLITKESSCEIIVWRNNETFCITIFYFKKCNEINIYEYFGKGFCSKFGYSIRKIELINEDKIPKEIVNYVSKLK